ncbi:MAG: hypothetical protein MJH10_17125 [Epibacterium sp.]|nr:hypothetical protein [Epibacterium sp.]NQX75233.1 hypothetical protein [Epibacterium sp.]
MHTISRSNIAQVWDVSVCSVRRWIADKDSDGRTIKHQSNHYLYSLEGVVRGLRKNRKRGLGLHEVRALAETDRKYRAGEDVALFVGEEARQRAKELALVLTPAKQERFKVAQAQFTGALVTHLLDRSVFEHIDYLRDVLILSPDVLYFVMTADGLNWDHFAPVFAVVNTPAPVRGTGRKNEGAFVERYKKDQPSDGMTSVRKGGMV